MGRVDGKVAIVTGGARGMGAAHARLLRAEGAEVVVCDILDEEGQAIARDIGATYEHLDVTDESQWDNVVARTVERHGDVGILLNNAGIAAFAPVDSTSLDDWDRVLAINLTGAFLGIRSVVPTMRSAGGGVIVNTSSTAGLVGYANLSAYVASKWGVRGLTKAAALDLAADGIRVHSMHPGVIDTPLLAGKQATLDGTQSLPIARVGTVDEVAKLMLYLVADATYSTGTEYVIDGGYTIR